jgi:hypothetical protein
MKAVMAVAVVVVAVSAVVSASASAASWHVGGEELVGSAALASGTTRVEGVEFGYGSVEVRCSGVELKGASIVGPSGGSVEHLVFKGCVFSPGSPCSVKGSGAIESKPLSVAAALGGKSPEDTLVLKPASGAVLAEFQVVGASCALAGRVDLAGKVTVVLPEGREELAEQELSMRTTIGSGELTWNSTGMWLEGGVKAMLASGKAWSFH